VVSVSTVDAQALQLQEQRLKVNEAEQNLRDFIPQYIAPAFIQKVTNTFWQKLQQRQVIHNAVDSLQRDVLPFSYYSRLNELLLEAMHVSLIQVPNIEMQRELLSCLLLSEVKEEDGKARGALNGVFASLFVDSGMFVQIENYIMRSRSFLRQAELLLDEKSLHRLDEMRNTAIWIQIAEIHQEFIDKKGDLAAMSAVTPVQWFDLATQRISMVKDVQDQAFIALQETLQKERFMLLFELLIFVLVSIATAVMFQTSKKKDNS